MATSRALPWKLCLVIISACLLVGRVEGQGLKQARLHAEPSLPQVDAAFEQEQLAGGNEAFDLLLLTSLKDRSLECAVLDSSGLVVWRGRAPSSWVILSPGVQRMALIGKAENEGFASSGGKTLFTNVTVQDFAGNVLYRLADTGPIGRAELSNDGHLLLLASREMRMYDAGGNRLWTRPGDFSEAGFSTDGQSVSSSRYDLNTGVHTLAIMNSQTGDMIKELSYNSPRELRLLGVRADRNEAIMSEFIPGKSPGWDIVIYDLRQWKAVARLRGVEAGPFSAAWGGSGGEYALLLRNATKRAALRAGEVLLGLWNPARNSFVTQSLGVRKVNFAKDRVVYDPAAGSYRARVGNAVTEFLSSK